MKKGKKVYIEGRIQTRSYDDKNTGTKRYVTEIIAEDMLMLDSKGAAERDKSEPGGSQGAPSAEAAQAGKVDEDLPF